MPLPDLLRSCTVGVPGHCLVSRLAAIAIPFALAVAACSSGLSGPTASAPASLVASAAPTAPSAPAASIATPAAPASSGPASTAEGSSEVPVASPTPSGSLGDANASAPPLGSPAPPVRIDPSLAALLPATVDGNDVVRATATEDAAQSSRTLGGQADGFAAVEVSTPDLADLAIASILRVAPATDAAAFYASDWRPGFDQAGCAPAGGIASQEVRTVGGRPVDTTVCKQEATIYHVRLDDGRVIVSVLEVGPGQYGRALIEGIKG